MSSPSLNLRLRADAVYARHEGQGERAKLIEEAAEALAEEIVNRETYARVEALRRTLSLLVNDGDPPSLVHIEGVDTKDVVEVYELVSAALSSDHQPK